MVFQNGLIAFLLQDPFYPVQISHLTTTKAPPDHHIASTMLDRWHQPLLQHLFIFCLTNVLLCDLNTSNLDSSVHNTFFQSSSVHCLCSFAHLNLFFSLASLRYGYFFATLPRRPASWIRLFTVDVETGVLWVLFNEASSWGLVRRLFLKLDTLMYLCSCSVVHWGLPLLFQFWLEPVCPVLWME